MVSQLMSLPHPARDQLRGTDQYGKPCAWDGDCTFSLPFAEQNFSEFLFSTGDCRMWLAVKAAEVMRHGKDASAPHKPEWSEAYNATVERSSRKNSLHIVRFFSRPDYTEEPFVPLTDRGLPSSFDLGEVLYGEHDQGGKDVSKILRKHWGANVFIR